MDAFTTFIQWAWSITEIPLFYVGDIGVSFGSVALTTGLMSVVVVALLKGVQIK